MSLATRAGFIAGLTALAGMLAGCNPAVREAEAAEKEYAIVDSTSVSPDERCAAARKVAQAWLKAQDQQKYDVADLRANLACNRAEQVRAGI